MITKAQINELFGTKPKGLEWMTNEVGKAFDNKEEIYIDFGLELKKFGSQAKIRIGDDSVCLLKSWSDRSLYLPHVNAVELR